MKPISKAELVEITCAAGNISKFYFPDNSVIRTTPNQKVKTKGIEFYNASIVPKGLDNTDVLSAADMKKGFCVLYIGDGEYYKVPISKMIAVKNNEINPANADFYPYVNELADLADLDVNYAKSYVYFPGGLGLEAQASIICNVYYEYITRSN